MLYGNSSISHFSRSNVAIWLAMAFQAGLLNIGGFFVGHKIVSHVTGFVTFFGYDVSQGEGLQALGMLIVPCFFLLGAMLSGYFVDVRLKLNKRPKYYITFGIIFILNLLVLVLGILGMWGDFGQYPLSLPGYILLIILCFVCGVQNGTISIVSKSVVRTTHLTGITTDLGLGIMRILYRHKLKNQINNEARANMMRIGIIGAFFMGSVVGGFFFQRYLYWGFLFPVLISGSLFGLMIFFQFQTRRRIN